MVLLVDALYAVYEASTLELWSFMMTSALEAKNLVLVAIFYAMLILYIVILLQVSTLQVIINYIVCFIFSKVYF